MKMKDIEQELTGEVDVPPTTVSVSPRHIDNGTVHCCRCPIALAIKDELGVDEVFVCENEISTLHSGKRKHYQHTDCLLYTSPSPRDGLLSRMPSSA